MADWKALDLPCVAATSSIVISASFSLPSSLPCPPLCKPSLLLSKSCPRNIFASPKSNLLLQSNPSQHTFAQTMAVNGVAIEDAASAQDMVAEHQPHSQGSALPEIMSEFMVSMKCEGCVSSVRNKLHQLEGVRKVDVDLANQVVRVQGTTPLKVLNEALEQTGRKARLIGQGSPDDFLISATVAEFKGPEIYGVVRFTQVSMALARIEASFSGLSHGPHGWSINEYGDLTQGAASTGRIYNPSSDSYDVSVSEPLGNLGAIIADEKGEAEYSGSKPLLKVADLIGRALVIYASDDKSEPGITAAVIARSAGVGENYKKLCTCDGTVIWEATNNDFVKVKSKI